MKAKATQQLHNLGQSIWLDNITRDLLNSGTLKRYIDELSVTGLTSNPTIFDHAIKNSSAYDAAIREKLSKGKSGEELFFELALEDITRAAALFRPVHDRTDGVDGWVSLEVSPLLAYDTASTLAAAKDLHARAGTAEPVHQDSRHQGRSAGDRGGDLCRRPDQRHPPVLARAVSGGGRGVPARHRAAHRRRAQPGGRLGGLGICQPLGRRGGGQGARLAARPARHRHRQAHLQGVPRAARLSALAARFQRRRASAAAAVGQHRNQGSQGVRRALRQGPRRAVHGEHHAGGYLEGARRSRRNRRDPAARTAATARKCWRSSPRPASMSTRWPPSFRTKGRSRSSSPGTS